MARVALIEPEQATPEVKEIYEKVLRGKPGNVQKALAQRPDLLKNFLPFYASVGRSLERKLYELVYIRVSMVNGCNYCLQHHLASGKRAGIEPADWAALKAKDFSRYTEKEQAALNHAEKLTRTPHDINDQDFVPLKAQFTDAEIVDLHMLIGLVNYEPGHGPVGFAGGVARGEDLVGSQRLFRSRSRIIRSNALGSPSCRE
jgi:uncharacterized peroxidase-related enzyme